MSLPHPTFLGEHLLFDNRFAVVDAAIADGWSLRGSGSFSRVLVKDDQALKIFSDDAYLQYITSDIVKNGSDAAPRILEPIIQGDGLAVVILEKLLFWPTQEKDAEIVAALDMVAEDITDYGVDAAIELFMTNDFKAIHDWLKPNGKKFFVELLGFISENEVRPDIKIENLMMRPSSGQIVFSDPVAQPVSQFLTFFKK